MNKLIHVLNWKISEKSEAATKVEGYGGSGYSYNPHVCLAEGSLVHTPEGLVPIEECLPGMSVLQCDEISMEVRTAKVRKLYDNGVQSVFKIVSSNGDVISATADHKFLFEEGWLSLKEATGLTLESAYPSVTKFPFFRVLDAEGKLSLAKTISVEYAGNVPVYDIEVASIYPNFICEGMVTHNSKPVALEPLGEDGGYSYTGPPPDFGASYGLFSDGENTISTKMAQEVFSPHNGKRMKYQGPISYEDIQEALNGSKFSKLLHSCESCSTSYVTSADHLQDCHCPACGAKSEYGSALMRGRKSRQ